MKRLIIPLLLFLLCFSSFGQNGRKEMQEKIKAQKVAFITEKLSLTPQEAQNFWPVYNTFEEATNKIRRSELYKIRSEMKKDNLSEGEARDIIDQFLVVEDKMHKAKQQLIVDLKKVLPPQKILMLKVAEDDFNRNLMKTLRDRRQRMKKDRP